MNIISKQYRHEMCGSGIIYFIIIIGILSIILTGLTTFVMSQVKYSLHTASQSQATHIAEAGVNFYRWYLAHQTDGKTNAQVVDFWENGNPYGVDTPYEADYDGYGGYRIVVTPPQSGGTAIMLESTGWTYKRPNVKRTIRVRLRRPSWSEYAMIVNTNVRLGDGTETFGPVHANGGVRFDGVAHNTVSSTQTTYVDPDTGTTRPGVWTSWSGEYNSSMGSDVFLGGKDFPVVAVDFAGVTADIAMLRQEAIDHGLYFDNSNYGRRLVLRNDGTVRVRRVLKYNSNNNKITELGPTESYAIPNNGVIYVDNNIWVNGRINNKRVTIVAADHSGASTPNIYIRDNIRYSAYDGSAVVGLIASGDIELIRNTPNNLRIDAALLAQNGRVGRNHYGTHKNRVTSYGSIATNQRYGFSWTDGTGYQYRVLIYDNYLYDAPPPFFPTGTHYNVYSWEEL